MQVTVKKWGNSLGLRIPKKIAEAGKLKVDQAVKVEELAGKIVITPLLQTKEYTLDDLLRQCPAESLALDEDDAQWLNDKALGKEVW